MIYIHCGFKLICFRYLLIYVFLFFRKKASKKISVNISGPETLKGASSKNIGKQTPPELMAINLSSASNDKKMISLEEFKRGEIPIKNLVCERNKNPKCEYIYIE